MKLFPAGALVLSLTATAFGQGLTAENASRCWMLTPTMLDGLERTNLTFEVLLDGSGVVQDVVVVKSPVGGKLGRQIVMAASRSIKTCGPYYGEGPGLHRITMTWPPAAESVVDPFGERSPTGGSR